MKTPLARSADWQSAVSPIVNRQLPLPEGCGRSLGENAKQFWPGGGEQDVRTPLRMNLQATSDKRLATTTTTTTTPKMNTTTPNTISTTPESTNSTTDLLRILLEQGSPRPSDSSRHSSTTADGRGVRGEGNRCGEGRPAVPALQSEAEAKESIPPGPSRTPGTLGQEVAALPKPTRDMINLMLDDGLPYKVIIDELAEAGRGISPQSLLQWLKTGYEDYLKNRQNIDEVKTQAEFAADLLRELGGIDVSVIHRACLVLTSIQIFTAIDEYGGEALRKAFLANPASYFTLLNSLCNTIGPTIALEKHRMACENQPGSH